MLTLRKSKRLGVSFLLSILPPQFVVPSWLAADSATSEKVTHSFINGFKMGRANYAL